MVAEQPIEDWAAVPWRKLEVAVYRLQKRIYRASRRGNGKAVHSLQRLLTKSHAARALAVRRVTQDNRGKKTAGVDGVKSLGPAQRARLVRRLRDHATIRPQPVRRVWIPKPGQDERRPLGIPTMLDRAHQALAKLALDPEWGAKFEPNSYGFRPGRSAHDAIAAIFDSTAKQPKYVLDADIKGCFDNIDHAALLGKLGTYPRMRRAIKGWLTAGVLAAGAFTATGAGTPQGGPLSPLLANIALHGLEEAVHAGYTGKDRPKLVRYADDFVVLYPTREGIERAKHAIERWLGGLGLELKPSKTRITHTLDAPDDGGAGFAFLGFAVRHYRVGRYRSGKASNGRPLGFKVVIQPSAAAIRRHHAELRRIVIGGRSHPQDRLIGQLNQAIRGWSLYYRSVAAKTALNDCDNRLFPLLLRWAKRRHPRKPANWVTRKYWRTVGRDRWRFASPDGPRLTDHAATRIRRHTKVRGAAGPFDGDLLYWSRRLAAHPLLEGRRGLLLRRQGGRCAHCGLLFTALDGAEIDHRDPRGPDRLPNLALLHRHCHDQKTAGDYRAGRYP